jgi:hypothetical protein
MRNDSKHDRLVETLSWVLAAYGFVLPSWYSPAVRSISLIGYADAIEKVYSTEEARNRYHVSFLRELDRCIVED